MNKVVPTALVVSRAFGRYGRGDIITDPMAIRAVLDGGNSAFVVVPVLPVAEGTANLSEH